MYVCVILETRQMLFQWNGDQNNIEEPQLLAYGILFKKESTKKKEDRDM